MKIKTFKPFPNTNRMALKMIAIIAMLIDHIGAILYPEIRVLRCIGRISFPIFVYQLVEGFEKTSNLQKYIGRILLLGIISEIPFNLAFYGTIFFPKHQNVFFELALCLITLYLAFKTKFRSLLWKGFIIIGMCLVAILVRTDYQAFGILLAVMFYVHRDNIIVDVIGMAVLSYMFINMQQCFCLLSLIIIKLFHVKQFVYQAPSKFTRAIFYSFYPVHIVLLYIIKNFYV